MCICDRPSIAKSQLVRRMGIGAGDSHQQQQGGACDRWVGKGIFCACPLQGNINLAIQSYRSGSVQA